MEKMSLTDKACAVIEVLVSDDLCESIEFRQAVHKDFRIPEDEAKILENKISAIYRYAHVANKPSCIASHDNWVKELEARYTKLKKAGYVRPFKSSEPQIKGDR